MFFVLLTSAFLPLRYYLKQSIAMGLAGKSQGSLESYSSIYEALKKYPFVIKYFFIHFFSRIGLKLLAVASITISILVLFLAQLYAGETKSGGGGPDYYLSSKNTVISQKINNFDVVLNQNFYFSSDMVKKLEALQGIQHIELIPNAMGNKLLLNKGQVDPFIKNWNKNHDGIPGKQETVLGVPSDLTTVSNVQFVFINDSIFTDINKRYFNNKLRLEAFKEKPSLILFFPNHSEKSEVKESSGLKAGEEVTIGRIERADPGDENSELIYKEWNYGVAGVAAAPYSFNTSNEFRANDNVVAVFHESDFGKSEAFAGYQNIEIFLKRDISPAKKQQIDTVSKTLVASLPGSLFYSKGEQSPKERMLTSLLSTLGIVSFALISIFSVVSITSVVYSQILVKLKEYSLFRVMGMRLGWLFAMVLIEKFVYVLLSFLISGVIISYLVHSMPPSRGIEDYLLFYIYSVAIISFVTAVSAIVPLTAIKNANISEVLRSKE